LNFPACNIRVHPLKVKRNRTPERSPIEPAMGNVSLDTLQGSAHTLQKRG
jgi:hypothetical protein